MKSIRRYYVDNHKLLQSKMDELLDNDVKVIIAKRGAINSFFVPLLSTKFIDQSQCKLVENPVTNEYEYLLPAEYARLWLRALYPPFVASPLYNQYNQSVPNWFSGQYINRDLIYFDLIGAYYQLYRHLWLDFTDIGMVNRLPLSTIADKLHGWKSARNSLVGTLASREICVLSSDEYQYTYVKKAFYNPMILFFVNSLLTELANIALRLGACYIATDCHIFECSQQWRQFLAIMDSYNLRYRCIVGSGTIYRFAAYSVSGQCVAGDKNEVATKTYEKIARYIDNPLAAKSREIRKLLGGWVRPLRNIDQTQSTHYLDYYKKISSQFDT